MKSTKLLVLFMTSVMLTGIIATSVSVPYAEALKGQGVSTSSYGAKTGICGDKLCSEIPGGREAWEASLAEMIELEIPQEDPKPHLKHDSMRHGETCDVCGGHSKHGQDHKMKGHDIKTVSDSIMSIQDPGLGHEEHQLAVLLPPSNNMYKGILTYSASETVQLVALHGPLTEDEVVGQPIWTPDGETKFALTLVDQGSNMGTWVFTGNALAAHTFKTDPFGISYTVHYAEISDGHAMMGQCHCAADCACDESGVCTCSGEAGPCMCGPNCDCGEHGTGYCAADCACDESGVCTCSGEAGPCMCGPNCDCGECTKHGMKHGKGHHMKGHGMKGHDLKPVSGTIMSVQDPGLGHENHQLAVLLPPRSSSYAGILTYSASETVQLVALHGPLTEDEVVGQPIWTPDGETKFALTLVDQGSNMGTSVFTGNALAAHSFNADPFGISYSIVTMSGEGMHEGQCNCSSDCNCDESGVCTCSGVEGPCMCGPHCNCGQ